jgi:hypothetical protein
MVSPPTRWVHDTHLCSERAELLLGLGSVLVEHRFRRLLDGRYARFELEYLRLGVRVVVEVRVILVLDRVAAGKSAML